MSYLVIFRLLSPAEPEGKPEIGPSIHTSQEA